MDLHKPTSQRFTPNAQIVGGSQDTTPANPRDERQRVIPHFVFDRPIRLSEGVLFNSRMPNIRRYVLSWIRNPDPGSVFAERTKLLRGLPDTVLCMAMRSMKYDGLVFSEGSDVLAHTFFQRRDRDASLHMFSVSVDPALRGQGLAEKALLKFVELARREPGVEQIRFGANGHPAVRRLCEKFQERQVELGIEMLEGGWAKLKKLPIAPL